MICLASRVFCSITNPPGVRLFFTRKVIYNVAKIELDLTVELPMGNLDSMRDWGFAGGYVRVMLLMLQ